MAKTPRNPIIPWPKLGTNHAPTAPVWLTGLGPSGSGSFTRPFPIHTPEPWASSLYSATGKTFRTSFPALPILFGPASNMRDSGAAGRCDIGAERQTAVHWPARPKTPPHLPRLLPSSWCAQLARAPQRYASDLPKGDDADFRLLAPPITTGATPGQNGRKQIYTQHLAQGCTEQGNLNLSNLSSFQPAPEDLN